MEESHGSCHCDPRGGLAGRASLLCSGVQAKPSLRGWLLATPFFMGGNLLTGDNVTLKLLLQRCNVWFTCFLPPVPFHSPHLFYKSLQVSERNWAVNLTCGSAARVRAVCGSQMDSKMDGVTGHPHETHQEHIKQNSNLSSQCKLDTSLSYSQSFRQACSAAPERKQPESNQMLDVPNTEISTSCTIVRAAWQNRGKQYYGPSITTTCIPALQAHKREMLK